MKSESFGLEWAKFFFTRDTLGRIFFSVSALLIAIWFMFLKDSITFGIIAGGSMAFTALFSAVNYAILGRYQQRAEIRFYDAIYHDCGFPGPYDKRDLKQIKVDWRGFRASRVIVNASSNSSAAKDAKQWRSIKLSVTDAFKITGTKVVSILDQQVEGRLVFVAVKESQIAPGGEYSAALFKESLHAFTYELLADYGTPLPRLENLRITEDGVKKPRLARVRIDLENVQSSYEKKDFESSFRQRYASDGHVWTFDWTPTGVTIESIAKGSNHDRSNQATKSISELIASSALSAFYIYTDSNGYLFKPNMIEWSSDGQIATGITIDFLQTDISRPDQVAEFEELMTQGLSQLFRGTEYSFSWNVSAFEKTLTIEAI